MPLGYREYECFFRSIAFPGLAQEFRVLLVQLGAGVHLCVEDRVTKERWSAEIMPLPSVPLCVVLRLLRHDLTNGGNLAAARDPQHEALEVPTRAFAPWPACS